MNRLAIGVLAALLLLSACAPLLGPNVNPDDVAATFAQQTMQALPTLTLPPTNTATAVIAQPSATLTPAKKPQTLNSPASLSPTVTGTITATGTITTPGTSTVTVTGTLPTTTGTITITPTDPMVPRFYGTQPPYVDFGKIKLVNQAKADVYVSFQCTTRDGYLVIVEYPVGGTIKVNVPAGHCIYVAWVGGRKFEGSFSLGRFEELTMTFKKKSVTIH